jgi:adenine/guanine phosphoribosyltransferase-like PRPP-binding protein
MKAPPPYRADWFAAPSTIEGSPPPLPKCFLTHYPVPLKDGCTLKLPLIALPGGEMAVALLMSNQTSFQVERHIVQRLTHVARAIAPEAVVGIPTLGLPYARAVAENIGLPDFVALGHSRKFWYDDELSEAAVSSTSPNQSKRIYLDPALLERVQGRRVVLIDDVLNTGNTMSSAIRLLQKARATVAAIVTVLTEGWDWHPALTQIDPAMPERVHALGHIPLFGRTEAGWTPLPETEAGARPAG